MHSVHISISQVIEDSCQEEDNEWVIGSYKHYEYIYIREEIQTKTLNPEVYLFKQRD